jgi:hypothetical protein
MCIPGQSLNRYIQRARLAFRNHRLRRCLIKYQTKVMEPNYKSFEYHGPETHVRECGRDILMGWRCAGNLLAVAMYVVLFD